MRQGNSHGLPLHRYGKSCGGTERRSQNKATVQPWRTPLLHHRGVTSVLGNCRSSDLGSDMKRPTSRCSTPATMSLRFKWGRTHFKPQKFAGTLLASGHWRGAASARGVRGHDPIVGRTKSKASAEYPRHFAWNMPSSWSPTSSSWGRRSSWPTHEGTQSGATHGAKGDVPEGQTRGIKTFRGWTSQHRIEFVGKGIIFDPKTYGMVGGLWQVRHAETFVGGRPGPCQGSVCWRTERDPFRRWTNYSNPCNPITPRTPNYNVVFWFGSLLRMDEINQTLRSGTKIRNHNVEIWGDRG